MDSDALDFESAPNKPISRRAFSALLVAGIGGALVACTTSTPNGEGQVPSVQQGPGKPSPPASPVPTSTASPSATATSTPTPTSPVIDPQAVAAGFAGQQPREWGLHMPGIMDTLGQSHNEAGLPRVALTFDACGGANGSGYDAALIDGLIAAQIPATLFVNQRWLHANPQIAEQLAAQPLFELANHGTRHVPLSVNGESAYSIAGSASAQEVVDEVWGCHEELTALTGTAPRFFRSGTAHYDEVAVAIVRELGEIPVGFSMNGDGGASFSAKTVRGEVTRTTPGGIVIAHFNQPRSGTGPGMLEAIATMTAAGTEFVLLS